MTDIIQQTLVQGATTAERLMLNVAADNGAPTLVTQGFAVGAPSTMSADGRNSAPPCIHLHLATVLGTYCRFRIYWWDPNAEVWHADETLGLIQVQAGEILEVENETRGHTRVYVRAETFSGVGATALALGRWQSKVRPSRQTVDRKPQINGTKTVLAGAQDAADPTYGGANAIIQNWRKDPVCFARVSITGAGSDTVSVIGFAAQSRLISRIQSFGLAGTQTIVYAGTAVARIYPLYVPTADFGFRVSGAGGNLAANVNVQIDVITSSEY